MNNIFASIEFNYRMHPQCKLPLREKIQINKINEQYIVKSSRKGPKSNMVPPILYKYSKKNLEAKIQKKIVFAECPRKTLGKIPRFAECLPLTLGKHLTASPPSGFAECQTPDTRQIGRMPSALFRRVFDTRQIGSLPCVVLCRV
jgi:hypothetical protein